MRSLPTFPTAAAQTERTAAVRDAEGAISYNELEHHVTARPRHGRLRILSAITSRDAADRTDWLHEIKHDGFRIVAHRDAAGVRLYKDRLVPM